MKNQQFENQNAYEGNGWSKYQLMVLQQLNDHSKVLQNLNEQLVDFKQGFAVSEAEYKLSRAQIMVTLDELSKKLTYVLYDEKGVTARVAKLEKTVDIEDQTKTKMKATWAFYGAIFVFLVDVVYKVLTYVVK